MTDEERAEKRRQYKRERYAKNKELILAQNKEWRLRNADSVKSSRAEYREKNREQLRLAALEYYDKNKDIILEKMAEYRIANPEIKRRSSRKRRARIYETRIEFYTEQQVLELHGAICYLCNKEIDLSAPRQVGKDGWQLGLHIEHVVDLALGGTDTLDNVKPSHGICNLKKKANSGSV